MRLFFMGFFSEPRTDGGNDSKTEIPAEDRVKKYIITGLVILEIMFAVSAIITYGYYERFWKINRYVHTWFWLDGLAGIVLFGYGICRGKKTVFKKDWIPLLVIPLVSAFFEFIRVVRIASDPFYGAGREIPKAMCYVIGFPLLIDEWSESRGRACTDMTERMRKKRFIPRGLPRKAAVGGGCRACPAV